MEELFNDFNHQNPNINKRAYENMHIFWPAESKTRLLGNLNSLDINIRRKSIKALSYFESDIIIPIVYLYLSSKDRILKISCLKILVKVAANNDVDDFEQDIKKVIDSALQDSSVELSLTLISLLRQLGKNAISILIKLAKDKDILRSKAAITALGELNSPEINALFKELSNNQDLDPIIREGALDALNRYY